MKKNYLLIAAAAAMFAACSDTDTFKSAIDDNETVMIGFETYHEKATRATATDTIGKPENFTKAHGGFGVWGYKGAPADIVPANGTAGSETLNLSDASKFTKIFDNVQVWYDPTISATAYHSHFTYAVPKYWDKYSEYAFFAYAPYDADHASFEVSTGKITIDDIPSIQNVSAKTGTGANLVFGNPNTTNVTDYLMAAYQTEQYYKGTNQKDSTYDKHNQTVGFTFGHMLSKLRINVMANDTYKGVKEMKVTYLDITNLPDTSSVKTVFTQKSPTAAAGTYSPNAYITALKVIDVTSNDVKVTSRDTVFVLKNGSQSGEDVTAPTAQPQSFNYFVAPNDPANNQSTDNQKHELNIKYTIKYTDGIVENVVLEPVDITSKLKELKQNNSYVLTIKIALNEILFTVDKVNGWATDTELEQIVPVDE